VKLRCEGETAATSTAEDAMNQSDTNTKSGSENGEEAMVAAPGDPSPTTPPAYDEPPMGALPEQLSVTITTDEVLHNGPCGVPQHIDSYTEEEHETWRILFSRQWENLQGIAYTPWLRTIEEMGLNQQGCPSFAELSRYLQPRTGWTVVGVSGFLHGRDYFWYLANKLFPAVPRLRPRAQLEFIVEPDLFHDAFGHVPMHADPLFASFVELYGTVALSHFAHPERAIQLGRLYWFTVEYGLIDEGGAVKVCGSGHLSGIKESRYSLTDAVKKERFDIEKVISQEYNPHVLQQNLFVMDSYEQVVEALRGLAERWD
jgi:phenylalanine-4-hydroxylase